MKINRFTKGDTTISGLYWTVILLELSIMVILSALASRLVFDESDYINTIPLVWKYGLSKHFFCNLLAAGPLYSWIHALFAPLTSLSLPGIRFVNLLFLLITIGGIALTLKVTYFGDIWKRAFLIMSIPYLYSLSGLAITNIPAMALFSMALALGFYSFQTLGLKSWLICILAAVCWAGALLGRQEYFAALLALGIFGIQKSKIWIKALLIILIGVLPFLLLVYIWGDFSPPLFLYKFRGFNLAGFFLGMGYVGISILFICPKLFRLPWKMAAIFLMAGFFCYVSFLSSKGEQISIKELSLFDIKQAYAYLYKGLCFIIAPITIYALIKAAWENRKERSYLYYAVALFGIMLSLIKAKSVPSRYVMCAAPIFILLSAPYIKFDKFLVWRTMIGGTIGLIILSFYLYSQ